MLEPLVHYARSHGLVAEPGFAPKLVRWAIDLAADGRVLGVRDLAEGESRGVSFPRCPELSQPEIKRGGPGCRHFLVDGADVVALLTPGADEEPDAKLRAKHAYFTGLLRKAAGVMPHLAAAADTLDDPAQLTDIQARLRAGKAKPTDRVTVAFPGSSPVYPVDSGAWHDWWRAFRRSLGEDKPGKPARKRPSPSSPGEGGREGSGEEGRGGEGPEGPLARCLATGELVVPVPTHPKIAGLSDVGGLAMGDVLASFKQESFCSYGFEQSANAPVSEQAAAEYRAALNHLIQENGHRLAATKVVPWYRDSVPLEDDLFAGLLDPATEEALAVQRVRNLLAQIESGERADLQGNRYYALTLSGASGRVMVRDWMEGSFEELAHGVGAWFSALEIVRPDGNGLLAPPRFFVLLASLVRELNEKTRDELGAIETGLWRAALRSDAQIPKAVMAKALARVRVDVLTDKAPSPARFSLLKAFLIRQPPGDSAMQPYLNEDHREPAYHCGRLLAMLAAVQYRALGDVGAGVVQRYYAAASTTPALVLGRLMRTAQFHLDKLDRGLARWHEGRIAEVWGRIRDEVPTTLDLPKQSLFALGYYQQIASDRSRTRQDAAAGANPETTSDPETSVHA